MFWDYLRTIALGTTHWILYCKAKEEEFIGIFTQSGNCTLRLQVKCNYAMNCAKGGVFLQLCGWMGVGQLWCGGISDSTYIEKEKILER